MSLAEDHDGRIWIGSFTTGLAAYDPRTEQFTRFPRTEQGDASPNSDAIATLFVDRAGAL